ncbi:GTPase HflX [Reichenbachiella sp. MALMAid0571]|uniref:GTPase HflX n=1 Tax=Reichenbachiella sp. MALMAid0571 TaxID=3143939 RepID=UPI0032E02C49
MTDSNTSIKDTAIIIAVINKSGSEDHHKEYVDELIFLAQTLNIETKKTFTQKLENPDKRTFIGKGKLEDVKAYIEAEGIEIIIFDDDLSPSQLRNIGKELSVKIYDRSLLILDIFLKRAKTSQAKTQVELARFEYLMPRLTRMWTHLERQRGGTSTRGGAGEKEIETDRRMIRNQISVLKQKLEKIDKQGQTRRKSRANIVRVALVGYTNVGKSTIMNLLAKENIYAKDELFATVDSTVRKVVLNNIPFLLSDTVGFIRKLPHSLIESFKSTLDEVREADILLHVVDISHPSFEDHIEVVKNTLTEIGAIDKTIITVYNKIDRLSEERLIELFPEGLEVSNEKNGKGKIYISATKRENIEDFRKRIFESVQSFHMKIYPNYLAPEYY